jgi:ketosteroid isomerase-like protein
MDDDLRTRLQRIEDRFEIGDLVHRYAVAVDDRDMDALRDCYTRDAVFDSVGGRTVGRDAVVDYYAGRFRLMGPTRHLPTSTLVEFLGADDARGQVLAHAELAMGGKTIFSALRYDDRYRREEGHWRFQERRVDQLYAMPLEELVTGLADPLRKRWPGTEPAPADIPEGLASWQAFVGEG